MVILEEETFKKFGYYPRDLKPKSRKSVIAACDECGENREIYHYAYRRLCRSCAHRDKNHSKETKKKISEALKGRIVTEATRQKISIAHKGRSGKKNGNWKGGKVKCICVICKTEFKVAPNRVKRGFGKYCSRKCMGIGHSKKYTGKIHPRWKGGKIKRECDECGIIFESYPSQRLNFRGVFCSRKCASKALSKKHRGDKNPSWKGGLSFGKYCEKWNEEFREYIRAKFGRVCFLCGKTEQENKGRKLSVHHISYDKDCGCAETEEDKRTDDATCQFVPLCLCVCHVIVRYMVIERNGRNTS